MTTERIERQAPRAARLDDPDRRRAHRRRLRRTDLLAILCWTSVAAAIALLLASGGVRDLSSPGAMVTALGIVAGLVGTDLILIMLVLAARIPFIDRTVGQDVAMALHRRLGKPALYLLLGHGVLLIVGYAITDGSSVIAETVSLMSGGDLLLALLGTVLLVLVVVTSVVAVRRRFPYEAWHAIHLLSYVAVLVAVPHQLSTGQVLAEGGFERGYWIALYVLAFGSIAWFRFLVPLVRTLRHRIRVVAVEPIAPGVSSIHLRGRDLRRLGAHGGQYAIWRFWSAGTWWHAHPISFSAVPSDEGARITVRELGAGTGRLARLQPGTPVSIEGPYGIFTSFARTAPRLAIITAGIGITPARALLEHSDVAPGEATVLLRGTDHSQAYLWDEMETLAHRNGSRLYTMLGRRPNGIDTWMSAESISRGVTIESVFPQLLESDLYVCGPSVWTDLVVRDARAAGLPEQQIHVERFDW
ncbi:Predicted ferric reductase [Plantibacter flavus]|uniref:Putative ferric reductase n=1 Tax=Plantibacter flavus TaxID=150123 RepID=A0A3N2C737_9MICO|nr:ferredoxin reductase family protein [Plantibacter flavus]ROR83329.1 putative ferric reductase [Plantibacter flavus]SMG22567.1 Predicted ferric reductase [Plantibacter flavus]